MSLKNSQAFPAHGIQSDLEFAQTVMRRDRKATAEFVSRYADVLFSYLSRRLTPNASAVEDMLQEVFLSALRSLHQYNGTSSLQTWILAIARNKVEDHYRAHLRVALEELTDESEESAFDPELDVFLEQERVSERANAVLNELPDVYRTLLRWRYWEGRSTKEMAGDSGRTVKSVERMLARAREHFRVLWTGEKRNA